MDPTMTLMLEQLRSVPVDELQAMLAENLAEHGSLRARGYGPGDERFDQNSLLFVVITSALEQRPSYV